MTDASWHEIGLMQAVDELEALRVKLDAHRIEAVWRPTGSRVVVRVPGPHIIVNGVEVPMKRGE